jgi:transposase-like protein
VKAFTAAYGAKFPKAAAKITDDLEELLAFYDYPCEHWVHLRTTDENVNCGAACFCACADGWTAAAA